MYDSTWPRVPLLCDLLDAPTALAACCGFDLCHKYILYLYLYFAVLRFRQQVVVARAERASLTEEDGYRRRRRVGLHLHSSGVDLLST